jgi:competence ComEA-like helix-hairpin-helix protein
MSDFIRDYFSFNKKERRGLFVLISILVAMIVSDVLISEVIPQKSYDFSGFEKEVIEFEKEISLRDSLEKVEKEKIFRNRYITYSMKQTDSTMKKRPEADNSFIIELNTADTFDFQRLRGIGSSYANRIVKYREKLGGYVETTQLLEIYGMDESRFDLIRDHVIVNPDSIRKIRLNETSFKELMKHPYFPFDVAKSIMIYRKKQKKFNDIEELRKIEVISDSLFMKIRPYVTIH